MFGSTCGSFFASRIAGMCSSSEVEDGSVGGEDVADLLSQELLSDTEGRSRQQPPGRPHDTFDCPALLVLVKSTTSLANFLESAVVGSSSSASCPFRSSVTNVFAAFKMGL